MTKAATATFVDKVLDWHFSKGRGECAMMDWLRAQRGRADTLSVAMELPDHPDWQPAFSLEAIEAVLLMFDAPTAALLQKRHSEVIAAAAYDGPMAESRQARDRAALERLFTKRGEIIGKAAWPGLLRWMTDNHPNPKLFMARAEVLAKVPASVDLSDLPSPARPQFRSVVLKGADHAARP